MSSATAERPKAAQRIQSAAKDLFYRQGIRATGVEEVCRVAEATKMSLYRAYPSKDALVAAILAEDAAAYDAWFAEVTAPGADAGGKLRAVVAAIAAKLQVARISRLPAAAGPGRVPRPAAPDAPAGRAHKSRMRAGLLDWHGRLARRSRNLLGDTLAMLIDGAWAALPYLGGARAGEVLLAGAEVALCDAIG